MIEIWKMLELSQYFLSVIRMKLYFSCMESIYDPFYDRRQKSLEEAGTLFDY